MSNEKIHIYVDETGDRGPGSNSSPIFGMAAVLVDAAGAVELRNAVLKLRVDFNTPTTRAMSWKEDAKNHDRRRRAAEVLGAVQSIKVCYVYAVKSELRSDSYLHDGQRFYNYVAYKTYKSALWAARNWKGSGAQVWTRFGHVARHDHRTTEAYIRREVSIDPRIPFHMEQGLKWVAADAYIESQAADLYGGFLKSAVWPEPQFGYVEPAYLLSVWHQIRNSEACAIPLGLMSMPSNGLVRRNAWFPCHHCTK